MSNAICPCDPNKSLKECCGQYLDGKAYPQSAEKLMRSRYSAFALGNTSYIVATTHPDHQSAGIEKELELSLNDTKYVKLEVLDTFLGSEKDKIGKVEFQAHYIYDGKNGVHHELSRFKRFKGKWVYTDGAIF